MGRAVLLQNKRQSNRRTSVLRKMVDGGIAKQLSAAEKRKRMLEAGAKFAAHNLRNKTAPSKETKFLKFRAKAKASLALKPDADAWPAMLSKQKNISPRRNDKLPDPSNSQEPAHEQPTAERQPDVIDTTKLFTKVPLKPITETFVRDDAALTSILNKCPQTSIIGRASLFRGRERPSLFPNGINPFDVAAEKFANRSFSLGPIGSAKKTVTSLLNTFNGTTNTAAVGGGGVSTTTAPLPPNTPISSAMKLLKRTPVKTVRFDESVDFLSPKIAPKPPPKTADKLVLDLETGFDDMLRKLRTLPAHVFGNLQEAVHQVASEKLAHLGCINENCSHSTTVRRVEEAEASENLRNCSLSRIRNAAPQDCIALRTRRQTRLSQVHTEQEIALTMEKVLYEKSTNIVQRPENPLQKYFETPKSHFRPIGNDNSFGYNDKVR